jgi:hypothetical protein
MDDPVPSVPAVAAPALHDEDEDEIFRAAPRVVIDRDDDLDDDLDVPSFLR